MGGGGAILVLLFLAVTSATSAELIAVSSILTYDVYVVSLGVTRYSLFLLWNIGLLMGA
jgi:Na+/proline symporter